MTPHWLLPSCKDDAASDSNQWHSCTVFPSLCCFCPHLACGFGAPPELPHFMTHHWECVHLHQCEIQMDRQQFTLQNLLPWCPLCLQHSPLLHTQVILLEELRYHGNLCALHTCSNVLFSCFSIPRTCSPPFTFKVLSQGQWSCHRSWYWFLPRLPASADLAEPRTPNQPTHFACLHWVIQEGGRQHGKRKSYGWVTTLAEHVAEQAAFPDASWLATRLCETAHQLTFVGSPRSTAGHFLSFKACQLSSAHSWINQMSSLTPLGMRTALLGMQKYWPCQS